MLIIGNTITTRYTFARKQRRFLDVISKNLIAIMPTQPAATLYNGGPPVYNNAAQTHPSPYTYVSHHDGTTGITNVSAYFSQSQSSAQAPASMQLVSSRTINIYQPNTHHQFCVF